MAARSQRLGQVQSKSHERPEAADMGGAQPTLQAAAGAFLLLPAEQRGDPDFAGDLAPVRQQPVQMERAGAGALCVVLSHRDHP